MMLTEAENQFRKHLWKEVALAVAKAENCVSPVSPGAWADIVLEAFDKRFHNASEETKEN